MDTAIEAPSFGARVLARVRGFHDDAQGQILPLVFAFSLAFFTGVVLLINTGTTVNAKIETQNAIDAANVSGATAIARGMNYLARNNVQIAKILATIAIVRAFDDAIEAARLVLDVWDGIQMGLDATAAAVAGIPPAGPAVAAALKAAALVIRLKVKQERKTLDVLEKVVDALKKFWTKQDQDEGLAWTIIKGLTKLGDWLAYSTPVIAQIHAKAVFQRDVPGGGGSNYDLFGALTFDAPDSWMIPFYPNAPICKAKFKDFLDPTTYYAQEYAKPITIFGWVALTLSLFPVAYQVSLKNQLRALFSGNPAGSVGPPDDPATKEIEQLKDENDKLAKEMEPLEEKRQKLEADKQKLETQDLPAAIAKRDQEEQGSNAWNQADQDVKDIEKQIQDLEDQIQDIEDQLKKKQDKIDENNDRIQEIQDERTGSGGPPDDWSDDLGDVMGGSSTKDRSDIYPYLIDGKDWEKKSTYFAIGWQIVADPYIPRYFKKRTGMGMVYAAAAVYNPTRGDLWTPDWRAKLVRADGNLLLGINPLGKTVKKCDGGEAGGGGASEMPGGSSPSQGDAENQQNFLAELMNTLGRH